jgi:hypothetical protein
MGVRLVMGMRGAFVRREGVSGMEGSISWRFLIIGITIQGRRVIKGV